jgi:hypothetical protein
VSVRSDTSNHDRRPSLASLGSLAHGPFRSVPLLALVILLHGLLLWALLQLTGRRAPDDAAEAVAGVLLFRWEQPASRDAAESIAPETVVQQHGSPVDPGRSSGGPAATRPPANRAGGPGGAPRQPSPRAGRGIDWYATGEAVAKDFAARLDQPGPRPLDRRPTRPAAPAERVPRSVFDDDTSRVGRTTRTADGETRYWITPNCYISLGSDSIALRDVHAMHEGMTFCRIPLGKRKARGDLFEEMPTQRGSRYAEKYDPASTEPQPVR